VLPRGAEHSLVGLDSAPILGSLRRLRQITTEARGPIENPVVILKEPVENGNGVTVNMDREHIPYDIIAGAVVTAIALAALVAHRYFSWCAAHDRFETVMLVVAFIPWAGLFFKSVDITGLGKVELRELRKQVEENRGAVASLEQRADAVTGSAIERVTTKSVASDRDPVAELESLGRHYVETRLELRPGDERTAAMSAIFGKMAATCASVDRFDVEAHLTSSDPGDRLTAYAFLYVKPDASYLAPLVRTVTDGLEDKPFGQYWGLRAIGSVIDTFKDKDRIPSAVKLRLKEFCNKLPRSTDRHFELSKISRCLGFRC